jgi:O-antigen ligase
MPGLFFGLCAFTVICCVVVGGGGGGSHLADGILQFLTLPLLLVSLWRLVDLRSGTVGKIRPLRWELVFCGAVVLVPLLQLVPLPPSIWSALPNRKPEAFVFDLLGGEMPWMPISVSPEATWLSALSLLPPIAVFLGCLLLSYRERRLMTLVVLSVGLVSVFLALIQVSQGPSNPWHLYGFNSAGEAVGFFANRNHQAALFNTLTPFAAAWAIDAAYTAQSRRGRYDAATVLAPVAALTVLIILVSAEGMTRSRAGLGLMIVAIFGAFALAFSDRRARRGSDRRRGTGVTPAKVLLGATALAMVFTVQFTLYQVMERFASDPLGDGRITFARKTIEAAKAYMPFGSGMGTFVPVYAMLEKPQDAMINVYANRAHDDFLELWLESGVVGIVLIGLFVVWWLLRSVKIWRRAPPGGLEIDQLLARAATLIIGLLMAHSLVEYPLRTDALAAIMAFACALLIDPPTGAASDVEAEAANTGEDMTRRRAQRVALPPAPPPAPPVRPRPQTVPSGTAAPATIPPRQPAEVLGENVDWPEAWRKPAKRTSSTVSGGRLKPDKSPKD